MKGLLILLSAIVVVSFLPLIYAPCCFPWETIYYIDPDTGHLIISGELWNDSYREESFGKTEYRYEFLDGDKNKLFTKNIKPTEQLAIDGGFVIPFLTALPFQVEINDVDLDIIKQVKHVRFDGTESVEYFEQKPADLRVEFDSIEKVDTVHSTETQDTFHKWQVSGTVTNTHSEKTSNVHVLASIYGEHENIVGVAGYSGSAPFALEGFETREFVIHSLIPDGKIPTDVRLYAESDDSSMIHEHYFPIILRQNQVVLEPEIDANGKTFFSIMMNTTNVSRDDLDFDFIVQIKKDYEGEEGISGNDPRNTTEHLGFVTESIEKQSSKMIEYKWYPTEHGVCFFEVYVWSDIDNPVILSHAYKASFTHHTMLPC